MTRGRIARHAAPFEDLSALAALAIDRVDPRAVVVVGVRRRPDREQDPVAAGQRVRPAMRALAALCVERGDRPRRAAARGDLGQSVDRLGGVDQRVGVGPGHAARLARGRERVDGAAVEDDGLQL
jgi:hypothetical protein